MKHRAFTLIELLIVVAIIAILAAIAVPNFLEAQVRAKVSRTKADMRSMATSLEAYFTDENAYPQCHPYGIAGGGNVTDHRILERLSTPVAYISEALTKDVFNIQARYSAGTAASLAQSSPYSTEGDLVQQLNSFIYQSWGPTQRATVEIGAWEPELVTAEAWLMHSAGPDLSYHNLGGVIANDRQVDGPILLIYDPTNGTTSFGSIYRMGGARVSSEDYAGAEGLREAYHGQR